MFPDWPAPLELLLIPWSVCRDGQMFCIYTNRPELRVSMEWREIEKANQYNDTDGPVAPTHSNVAQEWR